MVQPDCSSQAAITRAALDICRRYARTDVDLHLIDRVVPDDWGRSRVWRYQVEEAPADFPQTVIVKTSKIGNGHIFNEWASLQFLNQFDALRSLVPAFYGGDEALELLVMEDLGAVRGERDLGTIMEGDDPVLARDALLASARDMALLHTTTAGFEGAFTSLRGMFPAYDKPVAKDQFAEHFAWLFEVLPRFDLAVFPRLEQEAQAMMATLLETSVPRAYTRGDVCPSNIAYAGGRTRFYDFEMGAYRHVLLSATYFRLSHLSCFNGSLLPRTLRDEAERAYLRAAGPLLPDAAGTQVAAAAAAASLLLWMLHANLEKALRRDRRRHLATRRQRLFTAMTLYTEHEGHAAAFPELARAIEALRRKLDERWTEEEKTIPTFAAFAWQ